MQVMQEAEQRRPNLRRIGDQLGAGTRRWRWRSPASPGGSSGDPVRFLSVVVIATPCPLLIAIPVAIIGAISTAARRGIIVKDPAALEQLTLCRTMILDKTGTLTYGRPSLSDELYAPAVYARRPCCRWWRRSNGTAVIRSPRAIVSAAAEARVPAARRRLDPRRSRASGCAARWATPIVLITSRSHGARAIRDCRPVEPTGLECVVIVNDQYAATFRFHDVPRAESRGFVEPPGTEARVRARAAGVRRSRDRSPAAGGGGVDHARCMPATSPEEKVAIVRRETARAKTVFIGDGINDAPALMAATVGIAFGQHSDVTSEAARVVIIDSSLSKVDELIHLSYRLRRVALQSAIGGMLLSGVGMACAAVGLLSPVAGAVAQEVIDLLAVLNALRTASRGQADSLVETPERQDAGRGRRPGPRALAGYPAPGPAGRLHDQTIGEASGSTL